MVQMGYTHECLEHLKIFLPPSKQRRFAYPNVVTHALMTSVRCTSAWKHEFLECEKMTCVLYGGMQWSTSPMRRQCLLFSVVFGFIVN
jgi:hypothetical protein